MDSCWIDYLIVSLQEYIRHVDPVSHLGLGSDSVEGYRIGDVIRSSGVDTPELLPCGYLVGESDTINISLKGSHNEKFYSFSLFVRIVLYFSCC